MFGFLKKKLQEVAEAISGKAAEKSEDQAQQAQQEFPSEQEASAEPPYQEKEIVRPEPVSVVEETKGEILREDQEPRGATETPTEDLTEIGKRTEPFEEKSEEWRMPSEEEKTGDVPAVEPFLETEEKMESNILESSDASLREESAENLHDHRNVVVEPPIWKREENVPGVKAGDLEERTGEFSKIETVESSEKSEEPEPEPVKQEKKSFFSRLTEKVVKKVTEKKLTAEDVEGPLSDLENSMLESDVAFEVVEKVKSDLKTALVESEIKRGKEKTAVIESLRKSLNEILDVPKLDLESNLKEKKPVLVVFWGFNGAGKTTSLAKTASWLMSKGHTCVLAAADTFRAGAEEQLEIHANRIGAKVVKHKYGADPAAVIFDAVEHAKARGIDFVLADTAGRAHTNANLMEEMKKIMRVNRPDVKILVIDSLVGNDAVMQARMYGELGVDGLIFTKADVNEKGGAILSVTHELKKPILFIGMGQEYGDFKEFEAKSFVENLLA